ncbi:NAD(P)-dependent oxidoreductase [Nonomuraea helvata]|uniref:NAD(P)-dependent oxidoreductase n=1 Tax=Nonomuraea helvata TaxID=37484 RepID=A0ABV5SFR3_9ACTN
MKTWVPSDSVAYVLSELPGVECAVYDGTSPMPDGIEEDAQRRGAWTYHHIEVLADSTVLIVGHGSIGAALERRLEGFEVEVMRVAGAPATACTPWRSCPRCCRRRTSWCCSCPPPPTPRAWSTRRSSPG